MFTGRVSFYPDSFNPPYLNTISFHPENLVSITSMFSQLSEDFNPMFGCENFIKSHDALRKDNSAHVNTNNYIKYRNRGNMVDG